MITIFWDPAAAQVCYASLQYGKTKQTEVSTCLVIVPVNKDAEINPDILSGKLTTPTLVGEYNCLRVVAAFVPKQVGTIVESIFKMPDVEAGFDKYIAKAFPYLNKSFVRGWVHNHPSGVNPSAADERTFKGYLDAGAPYHLMVIYDPSFGSDKTVIYNKLYVNTDIAVPDAQPAPANEHGVSHIVMHNNTIVMKNPFIESYCVTQVEHIGLLPQAWRTSDFELYAKLVRRTGYMWPETSLCVNEYGEEYLILPAWTTYQELVTINSHVIGFQTKGKNKDKDEDTGKRKSIYDRDNWSTFENL